VCSFVKVLIYMNKTLRKVQLGNPKSDRGRLRELFVTKFKSQFKRGFTKVVATRAGHVREWSHGELRLNLYIYLFINFVMVSI